MSNSSSRSARRWNAAIILLGVAEVLVLAAMVAVNISTRTHSLDGSMIPAADPATSLPGAVLSEATTPQFRRLLSDEENCTCVPSSHSRESAEEQVPINDLQRLGFTSARGASPSTFCTDENPRGLIKARNVIFNDDCSDYIYLKRPAMTSPCALWTETMTGSNVQTTFNLTIAFTTPPMSMKIVIDDGPADTSITRTDGMWSVEGIFDTDDGDGYSNTGASLLISRTKRHIRIDL